MAAVLARTGHGVTGHPIYLHGIAGHGGVDAKASGDESTVNGLTMNEEEENWRRINGQGLGEWNTVEQGVDGNGLPMGSARCFCCPYGYHIDREFLGSLVRSSERNGANLQQLKKMHQRKLRHRQTMESLLMQSIPSSSSDFNHPEPVTPTTSDAAESDVSPTEESSANRDETTANSSILSELDETIAEALKAIDELMNSKRRPTTYPLNSEVGSRSDTGNAPVVSSTPSHTDSSVTFNSHSELNDPADLATDRPVRSSSLTFGERKIEGDTDRETTSVENRPTTAKAKPPPLYPKPVIINSRMSEQNQNNINLNSNMLTKIPSPDVPSVSPPNNAPCNRGFLPMNEDIILVKDASESHGTARVFPTEEVRATRPVGDLSSSSDLTKALAVLLPIDGKVGTGTEALVRLRQYIVSSLRQMRILEQQVKTIPVMHVRISVLKEEKKLLRLQLLSLQSGFPSAAAAAVPTGGLEEDIAAPSLSPPTIPPIFTDRPHPRSPWVGSVLCTRCRSHIITEQQAAKNVTSPETSALKSHPLQMRDFNDVYRLQQQNRQPDIAKDDDNQLSTARTEPANKRQLCKSISLNPSLLFDRKINSTQQRPEDSSSQNTIDSPDAPVPNGSSLYRRPEATFKRGLSLNEGAKTVYQRSRELQEKIASETNLIRNRWNAKSLEKVVDFWSSPPSQEPPKTFFNEPMKIRKVNLAKNAYTATQTVTPQPKPTPPQRQRFNAGIQCELLSTKTPAGTTTCPQCHCVRNPRKSISSRYDSPRVCDAVGSSATTIDGRSLSQTPDVIVTHRQASLSGGKIQETGTRNENGNGTNGNQVDSCSSKTYNSSDAQLKAVSKEVGCSTDEEPYGLMKSEASTCTDRQMFYSDTRDIGCLTDTALDDVATREASTLTEMFVRDSKEVACSADLNPRKVVTSDASSFTDEKVFKVSSKEVCCLTDANLNHVVTCDASCLTDEKLFKIGSKEVGCLTDISLDSAVTQDAGGLTKNELFKGNTKDVGCLTDVIQVTTCDASCLTDTKLFKEYSKDVECYTDVSLNLVVTQDNSSNTETGMFSKDSKEAGSLTEAYLSQVVTHDASSFTDKELLKVSSKEVGCLTDLNLSQRETRDASSFTEEELFKGYSKDVGCLTDVPISDVSTRDAGNVTEKAMFREYSKDVGCLTDVDQNKLSTRDVICFTEKEMLVQESKEASCMTDKILVLTIDASCNTEISHCENASQACFPSKSNPTTNEYSSSLTTLGSNFQTGNVSSETTGLSDPCGSHDLSKRKTHEVGCNTDVAFSAEDSKLTRLSGSYIAQSLCNGVAIAVTEVNNNVDDVVNSGDLKSRSENEPVVSEALLNDVKNSTIIKHAEAVEHCENTAVEHCEKRKSFINVTTSDLQSHHQTTTTTPTAIEVHGERNDRDKLTVASEDNMSKTTEKPSMSKLLEKPVLNERPSLHVGER